MRQNKKIVFGDFNDKHDEVTPRPSQKRIRKDRKFPRTVTFNDHHRSEQEDDNEDESYIHKKRNWREDSLALKMKARTLLQGRKKLPVYKVKNKLIPQVIGRKVSIVIGETGSGKSTQIPQLLMGKVSGRIAVTQPRRVAAINLASRVAEEYGCRVGKEVGFSVRFNNVTGRRTKLRYMTDGMLLREMMLDPLLSKYSTIIVDEAHERTILTDLLLGFLKELIINERKNDDDFRVIVMSATLDADKFSYFFNDAPIFFIEGRLFHVDRFYLPQPSDDSTDSMIKAVIQVNQGEPLGDILCFLPGQEDIDKVTSILREIAPQLPKDAPLIIPLPLYAALPPQEQMKVFEKLKPHCRKVILSTNIAETSVTVPGVKYVIDSGLRKIKAWRYELGLSTLLTVPISKSSASQRCGRAGREAAGKCFRLYTEKDYMKLVQDTEPEIIRSEIVSPVLMLKRLGVDDILNWSWLENPGKAALVSALKQLYALGAISDSGKITKSGEEMAVLPVAPHLAAVLIQARKFETLNAVIDIVACLSVDNLIFTPAFDKRDEINTKRRELCTLGSRHGDLIMLKELYDTFIGLSDNSERKKWCKSLAISYKGFRNVLRIRRQIAQYMKSEDEEDEEDEKEIDPSLILKSFLKGFITNTAIGMPDRSYRTVTTGDPISIHPSSLLFGKHVDAIMFIEHVFTLKGYARTVSSIDLGWLQEMAPELMGTRVSVSSE